MRTRFCNFAFFALLLTMSLQASGQALFSQSPPDISTARTSDFAAPFQNQQAQRFSLSSDSEVRALVVWGFYLSSLPADNFAIRFFQDAVGSPQTSPFQEITNADVTREDSGLVSPLGGQTIYKYTINLPSPVSLVASTDYYFSIVNNTTEATRWEWQGFSGGNNLRWNRASDASAWGAQTENLAFELYDTAIATPTPPQAVPVMPLWLVVLMTSAIAGIVSLGLRGRRWPISPRKG